MNACVMNDEYEDELRNWGFWRKLSKFLKYSSNYQLIGSLVSGVTRVGDTRGGNWGCHPSIFPEKPGDLFSHRCHYHYRFLLLSLGCHPPRGCHPTPFNLFDLVSPLFFVNLSTKNCFPSGVTPWRVSPGAVRSPSDATEFSAMQQLDLKAFSCSRSLFGCVYRLLSMSSLTHVNPQCLWSPLNRWSLCC